MLLSRSAAPTVFAGPACCWTMGTNTPARNLSHSAASCVITCGISFCRLTLISTQNLSAEGRKSANAAVKSFSYVLRDRCIAQPVGNRINEIMRRSDSSEKGTSVTLLGTEMPCKIRTFRADFGDRHKSILPLVRYLSKSALLQGILGFSKA